MKRIGYLSLLAIDVLLAITCLAPRRTAAGGRLQDANPIEVRIDPAKFDEYVGQYALVSDPDFVFSFFREGEKFYLQVTDQDRVELFPASDTKFFLKVVPADGTFIRDASGKVTSMVWRQGGEEAKANRTSNQPAIEHNVAFDRREEMIRM